jgi:hypothetical protein
MEKHFARKMYPNYILFFLFFHPRAYLSHLSYRNSSRARRTYISFHCRIELSPCLTQQRACVCECEERGRKKGLRRAPRVWLSDAHAEKNERGRAHATWAERGGKHRSISTLFRPHAPLLETASACMTHGSAALLSISTCTHGLKFVEGCCFLLENQCLKK